MNGHRPSRRRRVVLLLALGLSVVFVALMAREAPLTYASPDQEPWWDYILHPILLVVVPPPALLPSRLAWLIPPVSVLTVVGLLWSVKWVCDDADRRGWPAAWIGAAAFLTFPWGLVAYIILARRASRREQTAHAREECRE